MQLKLFPCFILVLLLAFCCPAFVAAGENLPEMEHVHEYSSRVILEATHLESGIILFECVCGDSYEEPITAEGHQFEPATNPPTCTENGAEILRCSVCGYEEVVRSPETDPDAAELLASGHEYTVAKRVEPTKDEDGYIVYVCQKCGGSYVEPLAEEEHQFEQLTIPPTCTENGADILRCTICGYEEVVRSPETDPDAVDLLAKGHNYAIKEQVDPTANDDGHIIYVCLICGDSYTSIIEHTGGYVAEMYICAKRQFSLLGHMWIYIQNQTTHPLQVGLYEVPAGEGVSVGTFALTRSDGWGIYYNVEAFCVNRFGLNSMICLEQKLTETQLQKISQRIRNGNYWTLILYNCMGSAFSIWNAGPGPKLIPILFPVFGRLEMMTLPHETEIKMYYPTENQVFKQRGNGENATLEKVKSSTLANGI